MYPTSGGSGSNNSDSSSTGSLPDEAHQAHRNMPALLWSTLASTPDHIRALPRHAPSLHRSSMNPADDKEKDKSAPSSDELLSEHHRRMARLYRTGSLALLDPTPYPLPVQPSARTAVVEHVEDLCRRITARVSRHEFTHPDFTTVIAPDFVAYLEHTHHRCINGRQAYLDNLKAIADEHPQYRLEIVSMSTLVDEQEGTATGFILMSVTGHPENVKRESVVVVDFKRVQGQWLLIKQLGVRGIGGSF